MKTPISNFLSQIYSLNISVFLQRIVDLKTTVYCHIFRLTVYFDDINGFHIKGYSEP